MRHSTPVLVALLTVSALATACGNAGDSTSRSAASGGDATGGDGTTGPRAGSATGDGGSQVATGGRRSDGGLPAGGADASGGATTGGRAPTGGATAGGGGDSATGGGSGRATTGGQPAGAAGSATTGGAPTAGQGGAATGGQGGAANGGNPLGGAGGVPTGGTGGATGGSGGGILCGVEICVSGQACCGPFECGTCVPEMSGQFCPETCPPGTGGAGGVCPTNYTIPDLDRTCTTAADCFLGAHWADCCGSQVAVSFARSELAAFTATEAACSPACTCAGSAPLAEDGSQLTTVTSAIAECVDGQCLARGPEFAGTCLTSDVCIRTNNGGECIPAPGPQDTGICRGAAGVCYYCECAAPDTPIATPSGEHPIAELCAGDLVYSVENDAIVIVPIARVNRRHVEAHHVVEVRLEGGSVLHISAGHPTADGRTFADLSVGGELDGERILSAELVPYPHAYTYDILPASSTGTYFAGGVQIGSTLRPRGWMTPPTPNE